MYFGKALLRQQPSSVLQGMDENALVIHDTAEQKNSNDTKRSILSFSFYDRNGLGGLEKKDGQVKKSY